MEGNSSPSGASKTAAGRKETLGRNVFKLKQRDEKVEYIDIDKSRTIENEDKASITHTTSRQNYPSS